MGAFVKLYCAKLIIGFVARVRLSGTSCGIVSLKMRPTRLLDWSFRILLFVVPFLFYPGNYELFEFNKMMAVYALTVIIAGLWIWRMIAAEKIIFRRTVLDIPLLIFLASQILSTIFSIDRHVSLWGYYSRFNGGLVSTVCYLVLYWAYASNIVGWETIKTHLKYLLVAGGIVSGYGVLEHFGVSPSCVLIYHQFNDGCWVQDVKTRVFATLGQPNWLAAWLVGITPVAWVFGLIAKFKTQNPREKSKMQKLWLWSGLSALFFLTTIYTKSRSGLLGVAVADTVFWGLAVVSFIRLTRPIRLAVIRELAGPFLVLNSWFLIIVVLSGTPWTPSIWDKILPKQPLVESKQTAVPALEVEGTETSKIREIVWKGALEIGLAHPILGTGVETFGESYYQFRPRAHNNTSEWDFLYNKAHNEFLNFWATTGIVGLGSYLAVITVFLLWATREVLAVSTKEEMSPGGVALIGFTAGYISILITNFFGFSVVNVQLLFFLFPAMAMAVKNGGGINKEKENHRTMSAGQTVLAGVVLLIGFILVWQVIERWRADTFYANSNKLYLAGDSVRAFSQIRQALELNGGEPVYRDQLAQVAATLAVGYEREKEATLAAQLEDIAIGQSDAVVTTSPDNLQFWNSRAKIFDSLAAADKSNENEFMTAALMAITRATELAPTHPKTFYNLGLMQLQVGEANEAEKSFQKSIELKPDYKEPRYALALLSAGNHDYRKALKQGEYILKNIDPADKTISDLVASWSAMAVNQ